MVRKLELRLQETKSRDYTDYLSFLKTNPDELQVLVRTLTIKVSNFFRNPVVFELLSSRVLPELAAEFGSLKVWSIGCANGEEPYSVAMIIEDLLVEGTISCTYQIQGTDVDPEAIERAKLGEYSDEELVETKRKYIDAYVIKMSNPPSSEYGHDHFRVSDKIRSMVQFSGGNIMHLLSGRKDYPERYNLILCRNILIYLNREMQEEIISALGEILYDRGYLLLGESETMPESVRHAFEQPFPGIKIFRKYRSAEH